MRPGSPAVEIADNADTLRGGCPDGEIRAGDTIGGERMSAELVVKPVVRAFVEEVKIVGGEERGGRLWRSWWRGRSGRFFHLLRHEAPFFARSQTVGKRRMTIDFQPVSLFFPNDTPCLL